MKPIRDLSDDALLAAAREAVSALPDAPPTWLRRADALWPAAASPLRAAAQGVLRRLTAVLAFDSAAQPALALGMRSAGDATRHLLYSVEGRDIDLRIAPAGEAWALAGQVLGPDESGEVRLYDAGGRPAQEVALDAMGEFRLVGIGRGSYLMTLRVAGDEIVIPGIEVGLP
jgi:hypothetical protein